MAGCLPTPDLALWEHSLFVAIMVLKVGQASLVLLLFTLVVLAPSVVGSIATSATGVGRQPVRRNMEMMYKTVRILSGPMKGYIGFVKDATESTVRVELHTMPKVLLGLSRDHPFY